jgi:murein DD-endopeptidase MepM/ murein hydrolase activator NlpD
LKIYNPAPGRPVTSPYGPRTHPVTGQKGKMHHGIDYGGSFNVLAAQDGKVVHIGWSPKGGGHVVIIKHASDLYTVYYHGAHKTPLKKGDRVHAGDFVYRSGTTGVSTGNHLHFECRKSRRWGNTFDPASIMVDAKEPKPGEGEISVPNNGGPENYRNILHVDGRLGRRTWKAWQEVLKEKYGYRGIVDGKPGKLTWRAIQRSGVPHGYNAKYIDGIPGPNTRKAVQQRLKDLGHYAGPIDGKWGKNTIAGLQRALNKGEY